MRFSAFSDDELDTLESGCCMVGAGLLIHEIRLERRLRENYRRSQAVNVVNEITKWRNSEYEEV